MNRFDTIRRDYVTRLDPEYHADAELADSSVVHQPDVYRIVQYLCENADRTTVIDLGCGNGRKLSELAAPARIGVDFGPNIEFCRARYPEGIEWIETDFTSRDALTLAARGGQDAIVVCADVIEHLVDPSYILDILLEYYRRGCIVVVSTPDRVKNHGPDHIGPPPNLAHVREWELREFAEMLEGRGLPVTYAGWTINNNIDYQLKTIITICDPDVHRAAPRRSELRPLAIISAYNEADMIGEVMADWLRQGCDVHLIDNWSDDGTVSVAQRWADRANGRVTIERFPDTQPDSMVWPEILHRKEVIAARFPGRWIIHSDADELRRTPFGWLNFADSLDLISATGANRVNFTCCNFYPTDTRHPADGAVERSMRDFEFGTRPGHFSQTKAWLQGPRPVSLISSGGHEAQFPGAKTFRYKFLLKHYPLRSPTHARRKIFSERNPRFEREKAAFPGNHVQYEKYKPDDSFVWRLTSLKRWDADHFWPMNGLLVMTDLLKRRTEMGLISENDPLPSPSPGRD